MMDDTEQLGFLVMLSFQVHKLRLHLLQPPSDIMLRFMSYKKVAVFMIISHIKQKYDTWIDLLFKHQSVTSKQTDVCSMPVFPYKDGQYILFN